MSNIMPKGEKIRKAVKWISDMLQEDGRSNPMKLIPIASTKFNLSPKEEDFLVSFYSQDQSQNPLQED